ncbi:hypothetical protein N7509_009966 [Penicillium cosmopolitanum]|uniref:Transcription factor domain-containing protein n=1 Tax=Penicillium cosmopolitanum TaxID=1131564 RepID=A0A9X0B462_9EURO|nr:uncharacterized protein N7509_009966 [Penicillium cosmopolitanum]KAJ5387425.1 hypothetical protein N7509_009966 [Penicillium cosmopolitanum]
MILSAIIDSIATSDGSRRHTIQPPGLRDAIETMQYLADRGNGFAKRGYEDASQTWVQLSAFLQRNPQNAKDSEAEFPSEAGSGSSDTLPLSLDTSSATRNMSSTAVNASDSYSPAPLAHDPHFDSTLGGFSEPLLLDTELLDNFAHFWSGAMVHQSGNNLPDVTGYGPWSTDELHQYLYPLYSNLDLDLTGGDREDFIEFRRSVLDL